MQKRNDFGGFSLRDLVQCADPYPLLEQARSACGSVGKAGKPWLVLGHAAGMQVLRSPNGRSGFVSDMYRDKLPEGAARDEMANRINFLDPPDHPRVRRVVQSTFTPKRIGDLRPYIETVCHQLIDQLAGETGNVDIISAYAHTIPSLAISELLGVPDEDREKLTKWAESVANLLGLRPDSDLDNELNDAEAMRSYLRALSEARRTQPRDDLLTALIAAEDDGDRLSEAELLSLGATLYSAGNRTTRDMFANGLSVLLAHPEALEQYRDGKLPAQVLIKEFLRYETPTFYVMRILSKAEVVDGVEIPANEPIAVVLAAGNRDPSVYADADEFRPLRWLEKPTPPAVLSFANGAHFCLGANMARLEAQIMLEILLNRCPELKLTGATNTLPFKHSGLFRSLAELQVNLGVVRPH